MTFTYQTEAGLPAMVGTVRIYKAQFKDGHPDKLGRHFLHEMTSAIAEATQGWKLSPDELEKLKR